MSVPPNTSREDVLAARQAKKKNKTKDKPTATTPPAKPEPQPQKKDAKPSVPTPSETETSKPAKTVEETGKKSREEVLAERETKRLAKQSTKGKPKAEEVKGTKEDATETVVIAKVQAMSLEEGEAPAEKSKAQLKAERRAKQEAQRAKKMDSTQKVEKPDEKKPEKQEVKDIKKKLVKEKSPPVASRVHQVKLFAHLYGDIAKLNPPSVISNVHSSIIRLGTQYRCRIVSGSNVRCLALLNALNKVIADFSTPANQEFSRGLEAEITKSMTYLNQCRPVSVSMANAVKHLKYHVTHAKGPEAECKKEIEAWIETYVRDQLEKAAEAICMSVHGKITHGDVILTYGCSSLIQRILISAHRKKIQFRVVVVDGRPWLEGREMLRRLVRQGIICTYVYVSGLSFVMPEITKVLLGTHALLANGYVMSRAGSSQVALLAKAFNVPVLVCCETHKFSERVQTDSFVYNELGDPDDLMTKDLSKWRDLPHVTPLNLTYDVTPPDLVTAVVTEVAVLPCTSVPVILRIKPAEIC